MLKFCLHEQAADKLCLISCGVRLCPKRNIKTISIRRKRWAIVDGRKICVRKRSVDKLTSLCWPFWRWSPWAGVRCLSVCTGRTLNPRSHIGGRSARRRIEISRNRLGEFRKIENGQIVDSATFEAWRTGRLNSIGEGTSRSGWLKKLARRFLVAKKRGARSCLIDKSLKFH